MSVLTVGSLFAGIGGIELGLEWTGGFVTRWQVERDEYCRRVLAKHWPNATRYDDVCTVGAHNLPPVDVICGGFPCQDISNAGKRGGIDGERSGLWREYARIVRELRPQYVLVENVAALLGRGLGVVLGDLAACGYDAEWSVLSAQNVGAPHLRERLFVVAYASRDYVARRGHSRTDQRCRERDTENAGNGASALANDSGGRCREGWPRRSDRRGSGSAEQPLPTLADTDSAGLEGRDGAVVRERTDEPTARTSSPSEVPDATSARLERPLRKIPEGHRERSAERGWWRTEPDVGRVAHGVPARVDRLRALGNAVVPQCAEFVGRIILDMEAERQAVA